MQRVLKNLRVQEAGQQRYRHEGSIEAEFLSGTLADKVESVFPGEKKGEHRANQNELLKPQCRDFLKVARDFRAKAFVELSYEFFAILRV
jgi:hypothetical protein